MSNENYVKIIIITKFFKVFNVIFYSLSETVPKNVLNGKFDGVK